MQTEATPMAPAQRQIAEALARLDSWIEREQFQGWDPHDALNSPIVKRLCFGNRLLGIAWVQLVRRCPVNLRALLGIAKGRNPKAMGLFLASYARKYRLEPSAENARQVNFFFDWLRRNASPGYSGPCWGYPFDWPNRAFRAPAGAPTIVNTAFIGLSLLDADRLGPAGAGVREGLGVARGACDFVLRDLNRSRPSPGELCFSYTPLDRRRVHNANLLGAQLLAETYAQTGDSELAEAALEAARFTASRQRPDGSWPYGEAPRDQWVDNFHTGFVLVALKRMAACVGTSQFDEAMERGYRFWKERMFLPDGTPKYYAGAVFPIDAHAAAQAVLTFLEYADRDAEALEWAQRVACWAIGSLQDEGGYFHYQIHRFHRTRIPYMRWSQAWMQRALTEWTYRVNTDMGVLR